MKLAAEIASGIVILFLACRIGLALFANWLEDPIEIKRSGLHQ